MNKILQHGPGGVIIGNNSVLQGPDSFDVIRRSSDHLLGFLTDGHHIMCLFIYCDHGRLVDHYTGAFVIYQCVRRSKVNG